MRGSAEQIQTETLPRVGARSRPYWDVQGAALFPRRLLWGQPANAHELIVWAGCAPVNHLGDLTIPLTLIRRVGPNDPHLTWSAHRGLELPQALLDPAHRVPFLSSASSRA